MPFLFPPQNMMTDAESTMQWSMGRAANNEEETQNAPPKEHFNRKTSFEKEYGHQVRNFCKRKQAMTEIGVRAQIFFQICQPPTAKAALSIPPKSERLCSYISLSSSSVY